MAGLPKGYGSVVKMKGKRIKPYMIRVPDGTYFNEETEKCYVQYKVIGYAKTKAEAISMLERYHEAPFDVDNEMTFADVFKKMFDETLEDAFKEEDIRLSSSQSRNRINEYLPC